MENYPDGESSDMTRANLVIPAAFEYVKTRRAHACEGCQKPIDVGTVVLHVHGRLGSWFSEYWCSNCDLDRIDSIPSEPLQVRLLEERRERLL